MIDGGKGLRAAIGATFGGQALIQRCRVHKRRNVLDHLPQSERTFIGRKLDRAWAEPEPTGQRPSCAPSPGIWRPAIQGPQPASGRGWRPCGSSTGPAVAAAANLCAAAIGTETDGSIVCPSGDNLVVGLKPTIGLISQSGIIPIAHSQDSAGAMARTVTDVAVLMNVLKSPWGPVAGQTLPTDYTAFLDPNALQGARIGIERRQFQPEYDALPEINAVVEDAIEAMRNAGAIIVDPVDTGDTFAFSGDEFTVLLYEFKGDIEAYLSGLGKKHMRTLADLISFNQAHCEKEMKFFGQEIFKIAESLSGNLNDPEYVTARQNCLQLTRTDGIDRVMADHTLDAVLCPSYAFASSAPACAGYPIIAVPVGFTADGKPAGVTRPRIGGTVARSR